MAAGYVHQDYPIASFSETFTVTSAGDRIGSWNALSGTIPVPAGSPWFAILMSKLSACNETRQNDTSLWKHQVSLVLGDADGYRRYSALLAQILHNNTGFAYLAARGPGAKTFAQPLSKARFELSTTSAWFPQQCTVSVTLGAGFLRVYSWSDDGGAIDVPATKTAKGDAVVNLDLSAPATKLRYKVRQTVPGDMSWSGTPVGTKLRRYT